MPNPAAPPEAPPTIPNTRGLLLPDLARVEDVGALLGMTVSGARRLILRGGLGPFVRVGRRIILRRESILAALREREVDPSASTPTAASHPASWTRRLRSRTASSEGE